MLLFGVNPNKAAICPARSAVFWAGSSVFGVNSCGRFWYSGLGVTSNSGGKVFSKYICWKPMNFRWWAVASSTATSPAATSFSFKATRKPGQGFAPLGVGDVAVAVGQEHGVHDLLFAHLDHGDSCPRRPGGGIRSTRRMTRGMETGLPIMAAWATLGVTVTGLKMRLLWSGSR